MRIIITLIFNLSSLLAIAQNNLDSLSSIRENLLKSKNEIEREIEYIEKQIITEIINNGYEYTLIASYKGEVFELKESGVGGNTIAKLNDGDKIVVLGKESIYYKVKYGELTGIMFLSKKVYPISLFDDYKYKDHIEGRANNKKTTKSARPTSSSTQCVGRTQKGARCKNMTTNSSGRCHLH